MRRPLIVLVHPGGFWKGEVFAIADRLGYDLFVIDDIHAAARTPRQNAEAFSADFSAEGFLEAVISELARRRITPDGIVTFFELAVEHAAELSNYFHRIGNSREAATRARDKYEMRRALARGDCSQVEHFKVVYEESQLVDFFEKHGEKPIILKPRDLGASTGVVRITSKDQISPAWLEAKGATGAFSKAYGQVAVRLGFLVEEMIEMGAREFNVDMLVVEGTPFVLGVAEKADLMDGPHFREDAYVFPQFSLNSFQLKELKLEARNAVRSLGIESGAVHLEAKVTAASKVVKPQIIEVAARCAGDLEMPALQLHCGLDLRELVLRQSIGRLDECYLERIAALDSGLGLIGPVAVQVKYAPIPGTIVSGPDLPKERWSEFGVERVEIAAHVGDKIHLPENEYLAAVIARGESPQDALQKVGAAIAAMHLKVEPFV